MSDILKPCPFCGGEAEEQIHNCDIWIQCSDCSCSTGTFGDLQMTDCREAWNTRHQDESLTEQVEHLKACKEFEQKFQARLISEYGYLVDVKEGKTYGVEEVFQGLERLKKSHAELVDKFTEAVIQLHKACYGGNIDTKIVDNIISEYEKMTGKEL